jgi:hypothetical protein
VLSGNGLWGGSSAFTGGLWLRRALLGLPEDLQIRNLIQNPPLRHPTTYDDCFALSADPDLYNILRVSNPRLNHIHCEAKSLGILTIACAPPCPSLSFHIQAFPGPRQKPTKAWSPSHNKLPP